MFAFVTRVAIEKEMKNDEGHGVGDLPSLFVLFWRTAQGEDEEEKPWRTNLRPQFDVDAKEARIEPRTHEEVVEHISRAACGVTSQERKHVNSHSEQVSSEHWDGEERSEIVDPHRKWEVACPVECSQHT